MNSPLLEKAVLDNHPVHLLTKNKTISPSAFVPFCMFGGNMSSVGVKITKFDVPVCNSFEAKLLNDQLCYEVDLNRFSNKDNIEKELNTGFIFMMDYNEDRQITFDEDYKEEDDFTFSSHFVKSDYEQHATIHLDTIGLPTFMFISIK